MEASTLRDVLKRELKAHGRGPESRCTYLTHTAEQQCTLLRLVDIMLSIPASCAVAMRSSVHFGWFVVISRNMDPAVRTFALREAELRIGQLL